MRGSKKATSGGSLGGKGRSAAPARQSAQRPAATTSNCLLWKLVAARHVRSAAETAPPAMFRPVAETIMLDVRNADPGIAGDAGIGSALKAITAGSQVALAAARSGIMCDFANRIAAAKATADPRQLAGILRAIKEQRQAALATAARNAQRDRLEKRQAVLQGGQAQRPSGSSRPGTHAPKK